VEIRRGLRNPWRRLQAATVLVGLGVFVVQPALVGASPRLEAVQAGAVADAFRLQYSVKKFLIVEDFIDAGGPVAQVRQDSLGSESFAALPDPGAMVINYNTVVGLATGTGLPFEYPFYASAKFPGDPERSTADPGGAYEVTAKAADRSASALARLRSTQGDSLVTGAVATSETELTDDKVTAVAETRADGVTLAAGAVRLAGVVSRSVSTRAAGEPETETETSLQVDMIAVDGLNARYGPKGFELNGSPVPMPSNDVQAALAEALKPLGVELHVAAPTDIAGGARAAVLELRQSYPLPAGEGQVIIRLGGAASAVSAADSLPVAGTDVVGAPDGTATAPGAGPEGGGSAAVGPDSAAASPSGSGATGSTPAGAGAKQAKASGRSSFAAGSGTATGSSTAYPVAAPAAGTSGTDLSGTGTGDATGGTPAAAAEPESNSSSREGNGEAALLTRPASSTGESVEGPFAAIVAGALAVVLIAAEWARRAANAALWVGP
jgi:hypothetical protein